MIKVYFKHHPLVRAHQDDVGWDIRTPVDITIPPHQWRVIPTGLHAEIDPPYYGQIAPRSGLAARHGIMVLGGVIDPGYRGEIKVILYNPSDEPVTFKNGDRIAQLIFIKASMEPIVQETYSPEKLTRTERGEHGLGSTGR